MEYCHITTHDTGSTYRGRITGVVNDKPVCVEYELETDDAFHITSFNIRSFADGTENISLQKKNGQWMDASGHHLTQFDDCTDIDISLTPLTNTFPINRLKLNIGESKSIHVIYIDPVSQNLKKAEQRYTCLEIDKYRYENLASGFTSDLTVDSSGLIVTYPGAWQRIYPGQTNPPLQSSTENNKAFAAALISNHPSTDLEVDANLYSDLIGSWKVTVLDYTDDDKKVASTGEWHFSWVLEGRAIQDIWIAPERTQRESGMSKWNNRYGTTLRTYNTETHRWDINWFNPVTGIHNSLTARLEGKRIVQEGQESDGTLIRWIFDDIKPDAFHWYGEISTDKGNTWQHKADFWAKRIN
jgi:hypothetical protein